MVVVVAPESESVMFNEMLSSGRNMAEPFRISVNFTVATGVTPDVKMANTNCQNGRVLATNYALDRTGQDQLDELESVRNSITIYTELIEFTKHVRDSQALVSIDPATGKATRLPDPPPPPPPPPPTPAGPDGSPAPPAPPATVSLDRQVQIYEAEKLAFEEREAALVDALETCVVGDRASGTVCGLTSNEARTHARTHARTAVSCACCERRVAVCVCVCGRRPTRGSPSTACAAAATPRSKRERGTTAATGARPWQSSPCRPAHRRPPRFFCGRDSDVNPLAADTDLRLELLEAGPFCVDEDGGVAACSSNASRTQRSGVYDLAYMAREDRRFCEEEFARQRLTPETATEVAAIELCRANLTERLQHCAIECDTCKAECTSAAVRAAASAYRCSVGLPTVGLTAAFHTSDIGQVQKAI